MIRLILNCVPRGVLQRVAGLVMPVAGLFYAVGRGGRGSGRGVECPLCGGRYRKFMPYGYVETRGNALCPRCLSLERHRLLWLWLVRETDLLNPARTGAAGTVEECRDATAAVAEFSGLARAGTAGTVEEGRDATAAVAEFLGPARRFVAQGGGIPADLVPAEPVRAVGIPYLVPPPPKFLHIAPEVCLSKKFRKIFPKNNYITADLESPLADVHFDVQDIPFPDGSFDVVFCNHVLEHVADDRRAMRELCRVTRRGGWGVLLVPHDPKRAETFEDDTITDPAERTRIFGQYDHRRVYGRDYATRLREAGWDVAEIDYLAALPDAERKRFALRPETLFVVKKP